MNHAPPVVGLRPLPAAETDLKAIFPAVVRTRGNEFVRQGGVRFRTHDDRVVDAQVTDSETHTVELRAGSHEVTGRCTCPYWLSHGPCKHMWATLVAAERAGLLARLRKASEHLTVAPVPRPVVGPLQPVARISRPKVAPRFEVVATWEAVLNHADREQRSSATPPLQNVAGDIIYVLDPWLAKESGSLWVEARSLGGRGADQSQPLRLTLADLDLIPDARDRNLLLALRGITAPMPIAFSSYVTHAPAYLVPLVSGPVEIPGGMVRTILGQAAELGRLYCVHPDGQAPAPLAFDDGAPFDLTFRMDPSTEGDDFKVTASLRRDDDLIELAEPTVILRFGWAILPTRMVSWRDVELFSVVATLRERGHLEVPHGDVDRFLERVYSLPHLPALDLPEPLRLGSDDVIPVPRLHVQRPRGIAQLIPASLSFAYGDRTVLMDEPQRAFIDREKRVVMRRNGTSEDGARKRLLGLGFRPDDPQARGTFTLDPDDLSPAVRALVNEGWRVEGDGRIYRHPGRFNINVTSGIDWFDVSGSLDFDGLPVALPALLAAARSGGMVTLGDGSVGVLPEEWLEKYGALAQLGKAEGEALRFKQSQATLIDILLGESPLVSFDETFRRVRDELAHFDGISAVDPHAEFVGDLRPYQRVGLGWLGFLQKFGLGGCLADDMGLGKTVQVLAHLLARKGCGRPSLVVMPKSLIWNWMAEARKFTPTLKMLVRVGSDRGRHPDDLREADVVLTTYGLLKNDISFLRQVEFDYVVLDEAQAVKNADSITAKAVRLCNAQHRLAMSGTPVENHLGELWSLFDFLNPGLLGTASVFRGISGADRPQGADLQMLARALRPFILRRSKEQVAPELPSKHEETLVCDLEPAQRRLYNDLRDHFRLSVNEHIERDGLARSKMHVLEALLRLRQAACHPGLIDRARAGDDSAKLDVLLPRLVELRAEGHKALVFSQFTSLLDLVETRLNSEGIVFERLDGSTTNRQERVDRFQTDPDCPVFLLSLKAGGVGLNLTAAEYVFILDPWWNPAVEAQAVDRAHRIGQQKRVFAYRLVCRDTVEEKIALLQESKRGLADALIGAEGGLIQTLDRETLELLLG